MNNKKRSAFTIVELVIVIAVIAILSAVLIPTFGAIIKDANVAADQTAAASLTTELHIYLKGNTITSEADLVKALNDPKLGFTVSKLTPKASSYGYHYWYDMENQTIIVAKASDVEDMRPKKDRESANVSFRETYGNGYYLIDMGGDLADAVNGIDKIADESDYTIIIGQINSATVDSNDTKLAEDIQKILASTTIKTEAGSFFMDGESENEYFSSTATYIGNNYVNVDSSSEEVSYPDAAPAPSKPVEIPSHIETAHDGSLSYDSTTEIKFDSVHQAQDVLANGSCGTNGDETESNTNVIIGETTYKPDADGNLADVSGEREPVILTTKLPFADYVIGTPDTKDTLVTDKIYVAYRNNYLQLYAINAANAEETSNKVEKWEITTEADYGVTINEKTGRLDITNAKYINDVCEVTVKATANNMNGETKEKEITVVVVKPVAATLAIGNNNIAFTGTDTIPTLTFNGQHTSYGITIRASYTGDSEGNAPLQPIPVLTITELDGLIYENKKLTFETKADGSLVEGANFKFTATVDGCFSKDIDVDVIDANAAAVKFNYKQNAQANRPTYYIGTSGAVDFSDLFTIANAEKFGSKAKVTVYAYAEASGYLSPKSEINKVADANEGQNNNQFTLRATYSPEVSSETWNSETIAFTGTVTGVYNVYIEVAPENDVSTVVNVKIVNGGINVDSIDELAKEHTSDVVLHKNVKAESGHKVVLGENSLYGNGWIITADKYTSSLATNVITDYFISVNGGTVDNVYIDGPVYPTLDYSDNANKYYVSGIRTEGTSTVSNSYVSGFRQPIAVNGGNLTVKNTTLYGGNYANLQLIKGSLILTDVTTVQPENGIADTFNDVNSKKNVIGMGIIVEKDAISNSAKSAITVKDGYLDQYNWVSDKTSATLPVITIDGAKMDLKTVLAAMFHGLSIDMEGTPIDRQLAFLDAYMINKDGKKYLNTGIIFLAVDKTRSNTCKNVYNNLGNLSVTESNRKSSEYVTSTNFGSTPLPLFSDYVVLEKKVVFFNVKITADKMMRSLEDFSVDSNTGKATASFTWDMLSNMANPIDVCMKVWSYNATNVNLGGSGYPIDWTQGYYVDYN